MPISTSNPLPPAARRAYQATRLSRGRVRLGPGSHGDSAPAGSSRSSHRSPQVEDARRNPVRIRAVAPQTVSSASSKKCIDARCSPKQVPALLVVHAVGEQLDSATSNTRSTSRESAATTGRPSMSPTNGRDQELARRRCASVGELADTSTELAPEPDLLLRLAERGIARGRDRRSARPCRPGRRSRPGARASVSGRSVSTRRASPSSSNSGSEHRRLPGSPAGAEARGGGM